MISATDTGLVRSLAEIDTSRTTLILDRGFVSEANVKVLRETNLPGMTRYTGNVFLSVVHMPRMP